MGSHRRALWIHAASVLLFLWLLVLTEAVAQALHTVRPGDTLYDLAERYGTSVAEIRAVNGLAGDLLRVGQEIRLPSRDPFTLYRTARDDESYEDVAARFGISVESLLEANAALSLGGQLPAGTELLVPASEGFFVPFEPGGSPLALALEFGVPPGELLAANGWSALVDATSAAAIWIPRRRTLVDPTTPPAPAASSPVPPEPREDASAWHAASQERLLATAADSLSSFRPVASGFLPPVSGPISSHFGWRNISVAGNRYHGGIDIVVPRGTPVAAAADGVVSRAGWLGAYGYAVALVHGDGSETRYAHLERVQVSVGETVRQGDVLGLAGSTGASTGPHLHFEIRFDGRAVDPLPYLLGDADGAHRRISGTHLQ